MSSKMKSIKQKKKQKYIDDKSCELLHMLDSVTIDPKLKQFYCKILWGELTAFQLVVIENEIKQIVTQHLK